MTTLPHDWPPLKEAGEAMARDVYAIEDGEWHRLRMENGRTRDIRMAFDALPRFERDSRIAAHVALLADLNRPTSRDFWARWLAERVGLEAGATAPTWVSIKGMDPSTIWSLSVRSGIDMDASPTAKVDQRGFVDLGAFPDSPIATVVPTISTISTLTDPAAALCAALLSVVPQ